MRFAIFSFDPGAPGVGAVSPPKPAPPGRGGRPDNETPPCQGILFTAKRPAQAAIFHCQALIEGPTPTEQGTFFGCLERSTYNTLLVNCVCISSKCVEWIGNP